MKKVFCILMCLFMLSGCCVNARNKYPDEIVTLVEHGIFNGKIHYIYCETQYGEVYRDVLKANSDVQLVVGQKYLLKHEGPCSVNRIIYPLEK